MSDPRIISDAEMLVVSMSTMLPLPFNSVKHCLISSVDFSDLLKISSLSLSLVERTDVKIEEPQRNELSIEVVEPPRKKLVKVKQPTFLEEDSNLIRRLVQFLFYFQNLLWLTISLILAKSTEVLRFKRMYLF